MNHLTESDMPTTATTSTTSDSGAATRTELIKAGRQLFSQSGFDGTSVRAITSAAGANLGSVAYHFGSKRGLYAAALEECLRPMLARLRSAAQANGSGLDRMLLVVEAQFAHLGEHPDLPRLLLQEVAAGKQPPDVVLEIIKEIKATIAGLHVQGVHDGSIRPGHPGLSALSVVSQPIYMTLVAPLFMHFGDVDLTDPDTRTGVLTHITTFVRAGLELRAKAEGS
jgi:AcrR family transcriptional regulator